MHNGKLIDTEMPLYVSHALAGLGHSIHEMCGYILKDWTLVVISNVSSSTRDSFEFDPDQQKNIVEKHLEEIVGIFHTHPSGKSHPSPRDEENWPKVPGMRYWIATWDRVSEWAVKNGKVVPVG